jgi:hypothetical protein
MFFRDFERLTTEHPVWAERLSALDDVLAGASDLLISPRHVTLTLHEDQLWVHARLNELTAAGELERQVDIKCGRCGVNTPIPEGDSCLGCGLEFDGSAVEVERFQLATHLRGASRQRVAANPGHYEPLIPEGEGELMYPLL